MSTEHAFAELGLPPDATESEVKAAWRRLVSQWHPDRNASAQAVARMQRINLAFEAIRRAGFRGDDADARASASASGPASNRAAAAAAPAPAPAQQKAAPEPPAPPQRPPIRRKLKLTLEEAAVGCVKVLSGKITGSCDVCDGAGYRVLGSRCPHCRGAGTVARGSAWFGWPSQRTECEACQGTGIARQVCAACHGSGKAATLAYRVQVRIPAGVRDGDLLHVDGRRARPHPAPAALEVSVSLEPHPLLQLDAADGTLRCEMPVNGFAWLAGHTVQVPTLGGPQPLALRRDTLLYRLPGQGFPTSRQGPRADQAIAIQPVFPAKLSSDQVILLDQLIATMSGPKGQPSDERLRAWARDMRAWERSLPPQRGSADS